MTSPADFLRALFDGDGFIEVRLIVEGKGGGIVHREWFPTPDALDGALPALKAKAEQTNAGVFFGVLPRRARDVGKAADTLPSRVVWADVDFKDFGGGEAEARAKLGAFPTSPSIVVRSAHGLHAYWLIDATAEPAALSAAAKAVAKAIGGDHTHDASRLLRSPGTYNRKNPAHPILVEVETFEPERRTTLAALLPVAASEPKAEGLSPRVRDLLQRNKKVRDAFLGVGKSEVGKGGKRLDTSSSGYDYTLACELAKAGVTDFDEIAAALTFRPDGHARSKGAAYARRTAEKAVAPQRDSDGPQTDFFVELVRKYDQTPARYEFEVEGRTVRFTAAELMSARAWQVKFLDALGRIVQLPPQKEFGSYVNGLLAGAVVVQMPPEASDPAAIKEAIQEIVLDLPTSNDPEGVQAGEAMILADGPYAGGRAFRLQTVIDALADRFEKLKRQDVAAYLKVLGAVPWQAPGGQRPRLWVLPLVRARGESGGEA